MNKLRIGWYSFTCCEDSTILFTEMLNTHWDEWKDNMEFVDARVLGATGKGENLDISFVEGAIVGHEQIDKLKKIRENSKTLVAIGACAVTAMPTGWRNTFDDKTKEEIKFLTDRFKHLDKVEPLSAFVTVDATVPGCPMNEKAFIELVNQQISKSHSGGNVSDNPESIQ